MNRKQDSRRSVFENLEVRRLLSTVNIISFGAVPNDGRDDRAAIQRAIDSSDEGDTVLFPEGTWKVGKSLDLKGGRKYNGDDATIKGPRQDHIFKIHADNVRVEGFTFDGKPVFLDKHDLSMNEGIVINNNTFHVHADGENDNGVTFTTGLRDSRITNNTFDPIDGDNGVYGYYWDGLTIANNEFLNGNEGIHVIDHSDRSRDLLMEQNYFAGLHRMGIEYQGGGRDTVVQDNYYEKPVMTSKFGDNMSTFAYSIIADDSVNTLVRRNTVIAPERPDGTGVRIAFEMGGDNAVVEDNYSVGTEVPVASNDYRGSTSVIARNNRFSGYLVAPYGRNLTKKNNDRDTELTWDVNRGKPGPHKRLGLNGYVSKSDSDDKGAQDIDRVPSDEDDPDRKSRYNPDDFVYVSDIKWQDSFNGWGAVERDETNGERDTGDGESIELNGRKYSKGLGVAVESEVVLDLDGKYSRFFSDVGIDDRVGAGGSMTFEVWADGKKVYDSGVITGSEEIKGVTVKTNGVQKLRLVTTSAGDGADNDHAAWAAARLLPVGKGPADDVSGRA